MHVICDFVLTYTVMVKNGSLEVTIWGLSDSQMFEEQDRMNFCSRRGIDGWMLIV